MSLQFLQSTTLQNVLNCIFFINQLQVDFNIKQGKEYYNLGCFDVLQSRQVLLQSRAAIRGKAFFDYKLGQVLQSGTTFIEKCGKYY